MEETLPAELEAACHFSCQGREQVCEGGTGTMS